MLEDDGQVYDYYWRFLGPLIYDFLRVVIVVLEPLDHTCFEDNVHDYFQPCGSEEVVNLDKAKRDFYLDLGHHVLPSPRASLEVNLHPCFPVSNAGFGIDFGATNKA